MDDRHHSSSSSGAEDSPAGGATSDRETTGETLERNATRDLLRTQGGSGLNHAHGDGRSNDHLASVYESQDEQFATIVPFFRDGLQSGEQCLYIADANTTDEVLTALRDGGIDVETARESGALKLVTNEDLSAGAFVPAFDLETQLGFWEESLAEATNESEFTGLRVAVEMTWALDGDASLDRLVEYEAKLNTIFSEDDYVVLCQYARERFPAELLSNVIQTHPQIVYDDTVCQNFYYSPPTEFFGSDRPSLEVDRKVTMLAEQTTATNALARREQSLSALNSATRELMQADEQEINTRASDITQEVLGVEYAGLWRYNRVTGELQQENDTAGLQIDADAIRCSDRFEERSWHTFVTKETEIDNDVSPPLDVSEEEIPIRSCVIVPLGRHGIICAGYTRPGTLDDQTIDLGETIGATIEAALDRAEREQRLAQQNDELTRLNRINSVIRDIDMALVEADTRAEIERNVCERLAASDLYQFAWIGAPDPRTDTIVPREWAGIDSGYLDSLTITTDDSPTGQGPVGTAIRTQEVHVIQDIITNPRFAPWREQTLEQGVRSCISIPLVYNDALYGTVTVYAEDPQSTERNQAVLAELGETVANAISSVETKQTLQPNNTVKLSLRFEEAKTSLCRLAQHAECQIDVEGQVPQADGAVQVFFTAHTARPDAIRTATADALAIEELHCLTERDEDARFKALLAGPTLVTDLIEQGARVRTLTIAGTDGAIATAVVALSHSADVRDFIESMQTEYADMTLVNRQTRERPLTTTHDVQTTVEERLTDRQREVLHTAYMSGFFESPRETTGNDCADILGVSQPTFTQHLRAGQHKLFELLFDASETE